MKIDFDLSVIYNIFSLLICFACILKSGMLFFRITDKKQGVFACFIVVFLIVALGKIDNYLIYSVVKQGLTILFFCLVFQGKMWKKLGFSSVLVATWEFIWNLTISVIGICVCTIDVPYINQIGDIASMIVYLLISFPLYFLFCRTKLAEGSFLSGSKLLFLSMSLLLVLIDVCNFGITRGVSMVSNANGSEYWNTTYNEILTHIEVFILSALCMVICLSLLFGINRLIGYITIDSVHKSEISRYQTMLAQYKNQINVRHDMKNHLISLTTLAEHEEWDKLKEYLSKIYNAGTLGEDEIETGNSIVNAIVNIKKQAAEIDNIKFECEVNISKPLSIDEYDLCVIWGNILDNAFSAASKADSDKYVYVQAEIVKRNLIINVKNSMQQNLLPDNFGVQHYGTGLMNVNKIVQKKNGIINIEIGDIVFDISIMLPIVSDPVYDIN